MKNFIFKSTDADFKKMFSIIETIQKNVLYMTYHLDSMSKEIKKLTVNTGLQKQVDEYFEEDETSPQTDTENKPEELDE